MSFFTHLECSVPCGAPPLDPRGRHHLCPCGAPLLARYDLQRRAAGRAETLAGRRADDVALPRADAALRRRRASQRSARASRRCSTLEALGRTHGPRAALRQGRVAQPDELVQGARSVGGDHARASTSARRTIALPSAGNAGNALPRTPPRPAWPAKCSCRGTSSSRSSTNAGSTARDVTLVDGLITDAGRVAAENGRPARLVRRVDAQGAVPHRRQEDDGLRARRAAGWQWPDWIVYPTGGGTGMVGMWKAFDELEALGWMRPRRGGRGWCRCRRRAARRSSARSSRAHEKAPAVGERRRRSPTACACPGPSAIS